MEFLVFEGDIKVVEGFAFDEIIFLGEGVRISLVPRAESAKCENIESMVSGGRVEVSVGEGCAGGEAEVGSGGLSMVSK